MILQLTFSGFNARLFPMSQTNNRGVQFQYNDGSDWISICELTSIQPGGFSTEVQTTGATFACSDTADDENAWTEKLPGTKDGGNIQVTMNFDPRITGANAHSQQYFYQLFESEEVGEWRILYPDDGTPRACRSNSPALSVSSTRSPTTRRRATFRLQPRSKFPASLKCLPSSEIPP